ELYLPLLKFLEPQLSPGALVVADDLAIAPAALAAYLDYVTDTATAMCPLRFQSAIGSSVRCAPDRSTGGSLHLEIELAHQRAPLGLFAVDVLGVLLGRRGERVAAFGQDALLDLFRLHQRAQRRVEPVDDRPRGAGGRQQAVVQHGFEPGHAGL